MLLPLIISFVLCVLFINFLDPIAQSLGLVDKPTERKMHARQVSLIGGLAICFSTVISAQLFFDFPNQVIFVICAFLICFLASLDDIVDVNFHIKVLFFSLIFTAFSFMTDSHFIQFISIFNIQHDVVNLLNTLVSVFLALMLAKSLDSIDSIDGLLGVITLIALLTLSTMFIIEGHEKYKLLLIVSFSILPFIAYNLNIYHIASKRIFMGKTGSFLIALVVLWCWPTLSSEKDYSHSPLIIIWVFALPIWDSTNVIITRFIRGKSIFKPDRQHIHHVLMRAGYSTRETLTILSIFSVFLSIFGLLAHFFISVIEFSILSYILSFCVFSIFITKLKHKVRY